MCDGEVASAEVRSTKSSPRMNAIVYLCSNKWFSGMAKEVATWTCGFSSQEIGSCYRGVDESGAHSNINGEEDDAVLTELCAGWNIGSGENDCGWKLRYPERRDLRAVSVHKCLNDLGFSFSGGQT